MWEFLAGLLVMGMVAGYLARLLVPGRDPLSFLQTTILGIVGSFVGGSLGYLLFDVDVADGALQPAGIIGSVLGATLSLLVFNVVTERSSRKM